MGSAFDPILHLGFGQIRMDQPPYSSLNVKKSRTHGVCQDHHLLSVLSLHWQWRLSRSRRGTMNTTCRYPLLSIQCTNFSLTFSLIKYLDCLIVPQDRTWILFQKEIHEQPESLTTTMRGRLIHGGSKVKGVLLGGLKDHLKTIRRSRRILFIGCGTSYYAGLATRALVEELSGENVDFSWMEAIQCIFKFFVSWSF
jgi:hypothetical protein